jgi:hypothetical protein
MVAALVDVESSDKTSRMLPNGMNIRAGHFCKRNRTT